MKRTKKLESLNETFIENGKKFTNFVKGGAAECPTWRCLFNDYGKDVLKSDKPGGILCGSK